MMIKMKIYKHPVCDWCMNNIFIHNIVLRDTKSKEVNDISLNLCSTCVMWVKKMDQEGLKKLFQKK
jgi:hypothetical protein